MQRKVLKMNLLVALPVGKPVNKVEMAAEADSVLETITVNNFQQHVRLVAVRLRFHLSQLLANLFIVGIVFNSADKVGVS